MTKNYHGFGSDKSVVPKNDVSVVTEYSPPPPKLRPNVSKTFTFLLFLFAICFSANAQLDYTETFTSGSGGWTGFSQFSDGTGCAGGAMRFNLYSFSTTATLASPSLGTANALPHTVTFDYKVCNWSANTTGTANPWGNFIVQWANSASGPWTDISTIDQSNHVVSGSCATKSFTFTPAAGTLYLRFAATWASGDYYLNFDNVKVSEIPSLAPACASTFTPANSAANVIRNSSLSWSGATNVPSSYDVYFGTTSNPPFAANVTSASYTPAVMVANTTYYWKVIPKNSVGPATGCAVNSFTTGTGLTYCTPTTTSGCTDGDVIARVILNTLDNNSGTGCPSGLAGYSDYTSNASLTTTLQAGSSYGCTVYAGQYAEGYAAWIDYNDDGTFDNATERIGYSSGTVAGSGVVGQLGSSATFPIVLSCSPPLGQHRLRVRAMFNVSGSGVTPCTNNSYGEVEDYLITITAADPCPAPSGLTAANATNTSANLSWNPGCAETNWEVFIQPQGSGTPTGSGVAVTSASYAATGLTPGPAYEYYVRANCLGNGFSNWVGPYVFTTPPCATLLTPANGATNVSTAPGYAEIAWASSASATSYNVYFGTTSGALTNIGTVTGTSAQITGLAYSTTYFWSIAPVNAQGATTGCTEFSFTTGAAPANDICSGAISLDEMTSPVSGSTTGLADNFTPSCNSTGTAPDAFYSITVPANYTLSIGQTTNGYDSVVSVFYGSCASQTEIDCNDDPDTLEDGGENVVWTNTTGATQTVYYVQDGYNANSGTYTFAWTLTPPPVAITGFTPESVCGDLGGTEFVISGSNFTNASAVSFNGIAATSFTVNSDTSITAIAPAGDIAGPIRVYKQPSANTYADSASNLVVYPLPVVDPITNGNATLCQGETVDLDNASPGGTWFSNNADVATVDAAGIVTAVAAGTATVSYSVTDNGCTTSVTTTITVNAPVVSTQPAPQTVLTGDNAVFSVTASGDVQGYQWQVSTDEGETFSDVSEAAPYSGTTTATLTITATPDTLNGNLYRVVITAASPCTDVETAAAILNVGDLGIEQQPTNVALCTTSLSDAVFTVVPSGTVDAYSWEEDQGLGFNPISDGTVAGVTYSGTSTGQLTVSGLTLANSGYAYRVVLTGPANSITSNPASVTVNAGVSIGSNPSSASVCYSGGSTVFTSSAAGSFTAVQWQYSTDNVSFSNVANGTPVGATYTGATSNSLTVTTTAATPNSGTYFYRMAAVAAAPCANAYSTAAQLIFTTPQITSQPSASSVANGASTTFSVATSAPSPTYQWEFATTSTGPWTPVANGTPAAFTYSGATTATLTVTTSASATASTARYYRATVTSAGCAVSSNPAQLSVFAYCTPAATSTSSYFSNFTTTGGLTNISNASAFSTGGYGSYLNLSASQYAGQAVNFATTTQGNTVGVAIWIDFNNNYVFDSGERVYATTGYSTSPSGSFTVPAGTAAGSYRMRIFMDFNASVPSNPCTFAFGRGEAEDYTFVVVPLPACSGTPVAGTASANNSTVCGSGSALLTLTGFSTTVTGLSIQWYDTVSGLISGATSATYTTPVLTSAHSYFARVTCANGGGFSDSNTVNINVSNPSLVSTTPATRCGVGTVTLQAAANSGNTVNWYASATGGAAVGSGASFTTPSLSATTTYYAAAASASTNLPAMTYCASTSTSTSYYITGFSTTGAVANISNTGTTQSANGYGNYTSLAAYQYAGSTVNFSVTWPSSTYGVSIFVDWNNDGDFNDANEKVAGTSSYAASPYTGSFTVPAGTSVGNRRMRVVADFFSSSPVACGTSTSNETEDYTFVVAACESARTAVVATVNTPPALTISTAAATICNGSSAAVTLTSSAGSFDTYTWSPATGVSGSAASGWSFSPTATTSYTLTATNATSGCANTAALAITVNPLPDAFTVASKTMCSIDAAVQLTAAFGTNATTGCLQSGNGQYPSTTYTASTCNGTTVNSITTAGWAGEYSVVALSANTKYVFSSSGSGDLITISNAAGTTVLAAGPSPLTYVSAAAGNVRFYTQIASCATENVSRTRSFVCSPMPTVVWSPTTGLYTDAAATVPYTGTSALSVYAKPSNTQAYTATASTTLGCTRAVNATVTVNTATVWYADADGDGYGDSSLPTIVGCSQPAGYAAQGGDCDDAIAAINPGHAEVAYNGIDDNCSGVIDEGSQLFSQVLPSQCGTTLATLGSLVAAVSFAQPIDGYRFKVVNTATNAVQTIDATAPHFQLTSLASYDYATTYAISVMLRRNGVWLNYYGPSCLVSTPAVLDQGGAASVSPSQCGIVLPTISTIIATTSLNGVTAYRFRVTNLTDSTEPNVQQVIERNLNWFSLTMLTRYNYGTQYQIEVAVKTANGTWSGYGAPCNVSSPPVPTLVECGAVVANTSALVKTTSLNRGQAYRFEITNLSTFQQIIVDRSQNWFTFTNVPNFTPGGVYAVRVSVQTSGYWSPFGEACEVTAPGAARNSVKGDEAQAMIDFRAVVYPNPYSESFALDMDTSSEENVEVKVYDMIGKLIDEREFAIDVIEMQQFGERYPSGVYNIVVTQAGFVKTLRVIKR